tara:strand:- start:55 stop:498 length:444 start_codon:yes stop_codon:yes gene_type:complete
MSTAASLASAKKRRGVNQNNLNNTNNNINNKNINNNNSIQNQEIVGKTELLHRHEFRLYTLEKLYSQHILNKSNNEKNNVTAKYDNYIETNKKEFKILEDLVNNQEKSISNMNSLIQNLKATLLIQEKEIKNLKEIKESKESKESKE